MVRNPKGLPNSMEEQSNTCLQKAIDGQIFNGSKVGALYVVTSDLNLPALLTSSPKFQGTCRS